MNCFDWFVWLMLATSESETPRGQCPRDGNYNFLQHFAKSSLMVWSPASNWRWIKSPAYFASRFKLIFSIRFELVNDAQHCVGRSHSEEASIAKKNGRIFAQSTKFLFLSCNLFYDFCFTNARSAHEASVWEIPNDYVHSSFYAQLNLANFTSDGIRTLHWDGCDPLGFGAISTFIFRLATEWVNATKLQ